MFVSQLILGSQVTHFSAAGGEYWLTELMALALSVKNFALFTFVELVNEHGVAAVARFSSLLGWAP